MELYTYVYILLQSSLQVQINIVPYCRNSMRDDEKMSKFLILNADTQSFYKYLFYINN